MYMSKQELLRFQAWEARFASYDFVSEKTVEAKAARVADAMAELYGYAKPTPWLVKRAKSALRNAARMKGVQYGGIE